MMKSSCQKGYTMLLAIMLIALIVFLVTNIADKSRVHTRYLKTVIDREKAKAIALSGIEIAKSQLASMEEPKEKTADPKKQSAEDKAKQFIRNFLPIGNSWQTFKLNKKNDGISGTLKICISCEDGKININQLFDFTNKKFFSDKIDYKKLMQQVFEKIKKVVGGENLLVPFEKFLKARQNKLYDPTELLALEGFKEFKTSVFFNPDVFVAADSNKVKQTIYLNDLFTLWSFTRELNPWFLSHSLKVLFGLKSLKAGDSELEGKKLQELLKHFKSELKWPGSWKQLLSPLYGKEFDSLPKEVGMLMSTKFEPRVFSVLSYGTVGNVTQKLLVIMQRAQSNSSGGTSFEFRAKKFYWL